MRKYVLVVNSELYHHGIKGQRWGVRRFQNEDGSYTRRGKARYNDDDDDDDEFDQTSSRKSKVRKVAAIIAGTAAIGATIYYAKKSGALDKGKDFVTNLLKKDDAAKPISQWKPKSDIVSKALASAQSGNNRSKVKDNSLREERRQRLTEAAEKIKAAAAKKQAATKPETRNLVDFTFERYQRQRPDGKVDAIHLPKDKEGYAKAFAQNMAKGKTSGKDYDYWLKYMTSKLKT